MRLSVFPCLSLLFLVSSSEKIATRKKWGCSRCVESTFKLRNESGDDTRIAQSRSFHVRTSSRLRSLANNWCSAGINTSRSAGSTISRIFSSRSSATQASNGQGNSGTSGTSGRGRRIRWSRLRNRLAPQPESSRPPSPPRRPASPPPPPPPPPSPPPPPRPRFEVGALASDWILIRLANAPEGALNSLMGDGRIDDITMSRTPTQDQFSTFERRPSVSTMLFIISMVTRSLNDETGPPVLLSVEEGSPSGVLCRKQRWARRSTVMDPQNGLTPIATIPRCYQDLLNRLERGSTTGLARGRNPSQIKQAPHDKPVSDENDDKACCICYERESNALLKPCGHHATCSTCAETMRAGATAGDPFKCPICRAKVQEWTRISIPSPPK